MKKLIVIFGFLLFATVTFGQDTTNVNTEQSEVSLDSGNKIKDTELVEQKIITDTNTKQDSVSADAGTKSVAIDTIGQGTKAIKYVMNTEQLDVRSGAGNKYDVIAKISQGDSVTILSTQGVWSEVELTNGTTGYVASKFLSDNQLIQTQKKEDNSWVIYIVAGFI